eukprot:TRINITY_DN8276_c0_g1_i1.p1 TRINITY_DN8276_c0_g1~~TRINITY_DN8276_c0_g1_i1.p1  ORF type:complete len:261 (-),score=40.60 TRINITY_DN8276_c0_g1_i1:51-833(-)
MSHTTSNVGRKPAPKLNVQITTTSEKSESEKPDALSGGFTGNKTLQKHEAATLSVSSEVQEQAAEPIISPSNQEPDLHPLQHKWILYFDYRSKKLTTESWKDSIKMISEINSVENFWRLQNNLPRLDKLHNGSTYHFFKCGIFPAWEDEANRYGGRWLLRLSTRSRDVMYQKWLRLLMACIGEMFDDGPEICGCVVNFRTVDSRISVWTRSSTKRQVALSIGKQMRSLLELDDSSHLQFEAHDPNTVISQTGSTPLKLEV